MATGEELRSSVAAGFEAFVHAWYGPSDRPVVVADGSEPEALRRWWALAAAYDRPLTAQNHVLARDECWDVDGLTVFYDENQSVQHWAHEASGDDPQVWEQLAGEDDWVPLDLPLSSFLVAVALLEAAFGPHALVLDRADQPTCEAVLAGLVELPVTAWPGARFFVGDDALVNVLADQPPDGSTNHATDRLLLVSAPTAEGLEPLARRSPIGWDADRRDDG